MYTQVKATTISIKPKRWDKAHNADKVEAFFRKAAEDSPDLILTTEGVLEGYVVTEAIKEPRAAEAMLQIAEPIDGPYVNRFRRLANELNTCLCFGFAERIGEEVYNAAVFIDADGDIRGKYHKTQLAEGTGPDWYFNRIGNEIRAFDTPIGRAGFLICNDRWNPTIARALVMDGARLLLITSYGNKSRKQNEAVLARARENGVPIVEANVGMNLIISKGEIVAYKWGNDQITTAVVDVPEAPSTALARGLEAEHLELRAPDMERRYLAAIERSRGRRDSVEPVEMAGAPTFPV